MSSAADVSLRLKRDRDRRAQQTFRTRRNRTLLELQCELAASKDRVLACEARIADLEGVCDALYTRNHQLAVAHGSSPATKLETDLPTRSLVIRSFTSSNSSLSETVGCQPNSLMLSDLPVGSRASSAAVPKSIRAQPKITSHIEPATQLSYNSTPLAVDINSNTLSYLWTSDPCMARESPEQPKPLDLLYGSRTNRLANAIHNRLRMRPCREPERLAYGWLLYVLIKWCSEPTPLRFSQLPNFLKPLQEQLDYPHSRCIDGVIWPKLRVNLILNQHNYDLERLSGFIACCLKVRWPWGVNVLEPADNGEHVVRKEFYNTFMSIEGWGLTSEFVREYPELLQGLDWDLIQYDFQ